jgi:hypothetical protein
LHAPQTCTFNAETAEIAQQSRTLRELTEGQTRLTADDMVERLCENGSSIFAIGAKFLHVEFMLSVGA